MLVRSFLLATLVAIAPAARADFIDLNRDPTDVGLAKAPRFGRSRVLVLPVEIANAGLPALDRERIEQFFTGDEAHEFRFRSYFRAVSSGRYEPETVVAPTMRFDGCPRELGGSCTLLTGEVAVLQQSQAMLHRIIERAEEGCFRSAQSCAEVDALDFASFDVNGLVGAKDGFVDGVVVVTNMPGVGLALPIYAINDGGDDFAGGTGGAFELDGVKLPLVAVCGGATHDTSLPPELGCVREFSMLLGLADLAQDPLWPERFPEHEYAGLQASLMGAWRRDDSAPFLDAESRYRLGWTDVTVVSGTRELTLRPAASGGGVVKLGMQVDGRREYFLVEARGPVGPYDRGLVRTGTDEPVYGLAVYHVDWARGPGESFARQLIKCLNCDPFESFIRNVQADRRFELQLGDAFRPEEDLFGEGDELVDSPNQEPLKRGNLVWGANWNDGRRSGIAIRNIRVNEVNGFVTAEFTAPDVLDACADLVCGPGLECVEGNCRSPRETPEPAPPRRDPPPPATGVETGWGCSGAAAGAHALAVVLACLLRRGRRRRSPD